MFKRLALIIPLAFLLSACSLPFLPGNQKSGLQVTTTPQSTVFLDNDSLGLTPVLEETLKPGSYNLRVVPSDSSTPPWETKVTLTAGVLTVIDRKLSSQPDQSHGYVLSFEKLSNSKNVQLAVTTLPDSVTVSVDGSPQGFSPVSLDTISEGDHTILLSSPSYEDKLVRARTVKGYRLTITAQLAKLLAPPAEATPAAEASSSATLDIGLTPTPSKKPTPTPTKKVTTATSSASIATPYVLINDTPTGFLRVRQEASSTSPEVAQVSPGQKFPYLTSQSGWHQIEYQAGARGWVSGQYATVVQ